MHLLYTKFIDKKMGVWGEKFAEIVSVTLAVFLAERREL
jgi:hypothetical protein